MKRSIELVLVLTAVVLFGLATSMPAQESLLGAPVRASATAQPDPPHYPSAVSTLFIPKSSQPQTPPTGHKFAANTNVEVVAPAGVKPGELPPYPGYGYETPASIGCVYGFVPNYTTAGYNCNPYKENYSITGGGKTIAIVDAYDDPSAPGDLAWFSLQFGLPLKLTQFNVVWANSSNSSCFFSGVPIDYTGGWEIEESLDIEWAHAMAPSANIYLVEACSNEDTDLQQAVMVASNVVSCNGNTGINLTTGELTYPACTPSATGAGEVSMSWGGGEFADESIANSGDTTCAEADDSCFTTPNIVYFASSGDSPGVIWPGTSPNVVSAGGLTNHRNSATLNYEFQSAWVFGGGGQSAVELQPSYQSATTYASKVQAICGTTYRCVPDLSFDADPWTGVYVYDTFPIDGFAYYEWLIVGGTSVSAPALAGVINNAASRSGVWAASSNAELTTLYNDIGTSNVYNITYGFCGYYMGFVALDYWNLCTGVGAPRGYTGK